MIPFAQYAKVKDKYCVCYLGPFRQHLIRLVAIRPHIQAELPGIEIFIGCRDELFYLVKNEERIIKESEIPKLKNQFGCFRDLRYDANSDPIECFLLESDLQRTLQHLESL
jgi:hypothetical protein